MTYKLHFRANQARLNYLFRLAKSNFKLGATSLTGTGRGPKYCDRQHLSLKSNLVTAGLPDRSEVGRKLGTTQKQLRAIPIRDSPASLLASK